MCVRVVFSSFSVAEWPPFGKWLLTRCPNVLVGPLTVGINDIIVSN